MVTRLIPLAGCTAVVALVLSGPAPAQDAVKKKGTLICGSFSAQPKTSPPWHEAVSVEIEHGAITVVRVDYPPPKGVAFKGLVAPSGAILIAGEGNVEEGQAAWTYEFSGKLNDKGTTDLRGKLTAIKGTPGTRTCSMSF
ncbi:MAG TPA: hypothetical protein VFB31_06510 [Pseudolabrys sp.]|nr:hypothetical protein [Pseudolabrys sp.]